jgi:hypothetical protein
MKSRSLILHLRLLAGALAFAPLLIAQAASVTWTAVPGTASWTNNANWSGGTAPAAPDSAFLTNLTFSYTVNFETPSALAISNLTLRGGGANTATLNINSGLLMLTGALASSFNSNSVLNVNSGGGVVNNSANSTFAGGTLNVNGGSWTNVPTISMQPAASRVLTLNVISGNVYTAQIRIDALTAGSVAQFVVTGGYANINDFLMAVSTSGRNPTQNVISVAGGVLNIRGASGIEMRNGSVQVSGGVVTNVGSLLMGNNAGGNNGSNYFVQTGGMWDQTGNLRLGNQSSSWNSVTLGGGAFVNHGTLSVGEAGFGNTSMVITNGAWTQQGAAYVAAINSARINMLGELSISGGSFTATNVLVANGINATGTVTVAGGGFAVTNAARTGVLEIGRLGLGTLNLSNGTLLVDRLLATNGASSVVNFAGGTLKSSATVVDNGSLFTVGGGLSAASLSLNGGSHRFANNLSISSNASLAGTGTVVVAALTSHGTIAPGFSPGTLTVTGDVTLASDSLLSMELAGTNAGAFDVLNVVGSLNLGGALNVSLLSYAPQLGDSFDLLNGTISGTFLAYSLPSLGGGLAWDTSLLGVDGTLLVISSVPEPGAAALLGLGLLAGAAWRSRRGIR